MRRLIAFLILSASCFAQSVVIGGTVSVGGTVSIASSTTGGGGSGCGAGYAYSLEFTLQKAVGSNLTDYPYPIYGTLPQLATVANLGQVQNLANNSKGVSGPADLVFCDASSGGTALKYETAYYSATTGGFQFFVQIPTLHAASNDSIWLFTNNPVVTTTQQDLSLWPDAFYQLVLHFADRSTLDLKDSSGNANDGTNHSGTVATDDSLGGVLQLSTAGTSYVNVPKVANLNLTSAYTVEAWEMPQVSSPPGVDAVIADDFVADSNVQFEIGPYDFAGGGSATAVFGFYNGSWRQVNYAQQPVGYVWRNLAGTWDGTTLALFIDGASVATGTPGSSPSSSTSDVFIGKRHDNAVPPAGFPGKIGEVRIASRKQPPNWLGTNWSTQAVMTNAQYQIPVSGSDPALVNYTGCSADTTNPSCTLPFPVTSGGTIAVAFSDIVNGGGGSACPSFSNDSLGNVYTAITGASGGYIGTLREYHECIYLAPITHTGVATLTIPSASSSSAFVMEIKNTTATGAVGSGAGNNTQPVTMTATCPAAKCALICTTVGDTTNITNSTTPSYQMFNSTMQDGAHEARTYVGYGVVGSGPRSCAFNAAPVSSTGGPSGAIAVIPIP